MDWDKLRIFHATAQAGSFTHAGSTLGLSQSAVSRHISQLERNLKTKLFHRHARGLILTEQGEVLYRTAREVFSKISLTEANISEGTRRPRGPLKVTATNGFAMVWITPNLAEFMDLYPEIELTLVLTDSEVDLSMREADLAIRVYRPSQPDLVQRHLMTVAHQVYASPEYLERHGTPQTIEDLNNHRLAVYGDDTRPPHPAVNWLLTAGLPPGSPPRRATRINNSYGLYRAVERGLGIASLPTYVVRKPTTLVRLLPTYKGPEIEAFIVYPEELRNSMRITVFRDFLLRKIAETGL
ncbi:MAG: LysR family transcriptional regulator [Alphaproteobacteria bacterium]